MIAVLSALMEKIDNMQEQISSVTKKKTLRKKLRGNARTKKYYKHK